jgi:hypothetical protein
MSRDFLEEKENKQISTERKHEGNIQVDTIFKRSIK